MKLRNKLIPLISLTATAATVAPLATSCGNISLTEMEMTDVLHGYIPDIKRAEADGTLTEAQAKDLYIAHVKENPEILTQDLCWWEALAVKYRLYNAAVGTGNSSFLETLEDEYGLYPTTEEEEDSFDVVPTVAKFGISDISIQDNNLVNPNTLEKELVYSISMKFNYEYKFEINADVANGVTRYAAQRTVDVSLTSEYKNIPITVLWDTEYGCWRVMVTGWYSVFGNTLADTKWITQTMENWCFDFDYKCITTDTIKNYEGGTDTYTYDDSMGGKIDSYAKLVNWIPDDDEAETKVRGIVINFGSYHMYDVLGPKWSYGNLGCLNYVTNITYESNYQFRITMGSALTRSWTYAEYYSDTRPASKKDWSLTSAKTPAGVETFDMVGSWLEEQITVGTVKFNDGVTIAEKGQHGTQTEFNLTISATLTVTNDTIKQIIDDGDTETIIKLITNKEFTFTIPNQTEFTFHVYHGVDEEGTDVYVDETFKTALDIKCLWSSTNDVVKK